MTQTNARSLSASAILAMFLLASCAERIAIAPLAQQPPSASPATDAELKRVRCEVDVRSKHLACGTGAPLGAASADYIVGGQGAYVQLASTNVSYDAGAQTLSADVTLTNLLPDALGTIDGTTLSSTGVRVFFESEPVLTSGSGSVYVQNPDGTGTFTESNQSYFQYSQVLASNATSAAKRWQFHVPASATFEFYVYVSAAVQSRLVITEIMANPQVAADASGEWMEIYNAGRAAVDLAGWAIASNSGQSHTITPNATTCGSSGCSVIVAPGGYVVLGNNRTTSSNGGVPVDYQWPDGTGAAQINLANSNASEFVAIVSPGGIEIDRTTWGSTSIIPNGISVCLTSTSADNSTLTSPTWQQSTSAWSGSGGDKGSPGAANAGCGSAPAAGSVKTVTVSPSTFALTVGETHQYTATGRDSVGTAASTTFTWTIDDPSIATINASTGVATGVAAGTTTLHATSANGIIGSATISVSQSFSSAVYRNNLEFGTPTDADGSDDIIITRPQYALSYNSARGVPNWVSWNLNKTHFGAAARCDCFAPDPLLPPGAKVVVTGDYTGSGYSRGHMVMSEERTTTNAENQTTFYTTNVLPQYQDLNGGPWLRFENYNNDLARLGNKELYVISGGTYTASPATLNNAGKVQIPSYTWKIVVVLDSGKTLANVATTSDLQVIAVSMPNVLGISGQQWQSYITTVDAIEAATGYDFLASLPDAIENAVEGAPYVPPAALIPMQGPPVAPLRLAPLSMRGAMRP
ncbi:MAG: non-specific endonuclease [Gemmatimonadetes bacterium]|nr:non-specific endonuclease [Gemmatimonadota bacterium]